MALLGTFQAAGTEVSPPGSSTTTGNSTCDHEATAKMSKKQTEFPKMVPQYGKQQISKQFLNMLMLFSVTIVNRCEINIAHQRRHSVEHSQLVCLALRLVLAELDPDQSGSTHQTAELLKDYLKPITQ